MKNTFTILCLFFTLNTFSQYKNDSTAIVNLLINDYNTMGTWDLKKHVANCTDNYLLVENGEIWDMKRESKWYHENANRIINRKNYFDIKYVRIYKDIGYAVYNLRSDITEKGILTTKTWLESVIFRKGKGLWKIELIHSTPTELKK